MFSTFGVQDIVGNLTATLQTNTWYHMVAVSDSTYVYLYCNGQLVTNMYYTAAADAVIEPLLLGQQDSTATPQPLNGRLNEVAIYNTALSPGQVLAHYQARYSKVVPPSVSAPLAVPPTNYVGLSASLQAQAQGPLLNFQWFQNGSPLAGQTSATLLLSPLQLTNAGSYYVQVSNPAGTNDSSSVSLTVLDDPTNAAQLNLTGGLVLHLPFDGDCNDYSGRNNNGAAVGAPTFVSPGAIGASALHYSTTVPTSYNYVALGTPADLLFGSDVDFSVSFWVRQDPGSTYFDLPFIGNAQAAIGHPGWCFVPESGGWVWSLDAGPVNAEDAGPAASINDGNWHHLVFTFSRSSSAMTYLDGQFVDQKTITQIGDVDTGFNINIGQDSTGTWAYNGSADIDDMGIWRRALTPLEISGIYVAGVTNSVSFAPDFVPQPFLMFQIPGPGQLNLMWTSGTLQSSANVAGPYSDVQNASSPWPVSTTTGQAFYRLRQ
jgi:hypothetical protein